MLTKYRQLDLLDTIYENPLIERIGELINCQDLTVLVAIAKAVDNFQAIPKGGIYVLSFSGGKDSHVLLAIYHLYLKLGFPPLSLEVRFADTELEHHSLYKTIERTEKYCLENDLPWQIVKGKQSYWFVQFIQEE